MDTMFGIMYHARTLFYVLRNATKYIVGVESIPQRITPILATLSYLVYLLENSNTRNDVTIASHIASSPPSLEKIVCRARDADGNKLKMNRKVNITLR